MTTDRPLISVIMPTYNRAGVLPRTLANVFEQTWRPLELVVVNDGSKDNTAEVLEAARPGAEAAGVKLVTATQDNAGVSATRNHAMRLAGGSYFAFLDDDDLWKPEKLERQMAAIGSADACVCTVSKSGGKGLIPRDASLHHRGRDPRPFLRHETSFHIISLLVKASVARDTGEFETSLRTAEDTEWMMRLVHRADFVALDDVLGSYEVTAGSLSEAGSLQQMVRADEGPRRMLQLVRERCSALTGWDEAAWQALVARHYDQFVKHLLYVGELKAARAMFDEGMQLCGGIEPLARTRRKLRKARWLGLVGKRIKHPKFKGK
jgi:glycosyltransferase involved in cell wall biosynthesis